MLTTGIFLSMAGCRELFPLTYGIWGACAPYPVRYWGKTGGFLSGIVFVRLIVKAMLNLHPGTFSGYRDSSKANLAQGFSPGREIRKSPNVMNIIFHIR
ncbi:hypothetical protein DF182_13560 [Chitinophaga flava]|uniref:Uncharacterized protein n=1 Tax=Chitinophaga flava TaxID=2259036 RepID=A0A365Y4M5_9BACT|nr:hypothetical protein DF182_13560 [Chitinophaga flava]